MCADSNESTPPPELVTPQAHAAQDRRIAKDIALTEQQAQAAMAEVEGAAQLAEGGYTPDLFRTVLLPLQVEALNTFAVRQAADGAQTAATAAVKSADKNLRDFHTKQRELGRSAFQKDSAARQTLGLDGRAPRTQAELITASRTLIKVAGDNSAYAARLASKAVTAAKLTRLGELVDVLEAANLAQEAALAAAPKATRDRNAAYQAMKDWMTEYRAFAKAQFKDRPDILKRLLLA